MSGHLEHWILGKMHLHLTGSFVRLEEPTHGIRDHGLKITEAVTLCGDTTTTKRIVPAGHIAACFAARLDDEGNCCVHASKLGPDENVARAESGE